MHRTFIKDNVRRPIAAATATTSDAAAAAAANELHRLFDLAIPRCGANEIRKCRPTSAAAVAAAAAAATAAAAAAAVAAAANRKIKPRRNDTSKTIAENDPSVLNVDTVGSTL